MLTVAKPNIPLVLVAPPIGLVLAAAAIHGLTMLLPPPADIDLSRTRVSDGGAFVATIEPPERIEIGTVQTWTVDLRMADGAPVEISDVSVDGGMPAHGHGLPTVPQVSRDLGDGRFEVENVELSMPGWWVVNVHVATADGADQVTFNFSL